MRVSGTIFIEITTCKSLCLDWDWLSGKYRFHEITENKCSFVREGGQVPHAGRPPYFLVYKDNAWRISNNEWFESREKKGFLWVETEGLKNKRIFLRIF